MQKKPLVALMAATAILAGCGEATNAQKGGDKLLLL
ncbi:RND efflux system membrane fusion protein CmeA [Vibrio rotiferianus CAIM 577 = LMG 21460]|nr:RND efflux system membrane fusion protein CmeA [Vibrio rotiferianus CAIM 577 = LMG 21460]